jgi:hypothetical protein
MFSPHPLHFTAKSQTRDSGKFHIQATIGEQTENTQEAELWIAMG